ncbi:MAG: VOC family protein [Acidobacteria bacterium]|nr:VOC family protein [Acidobacteriota bacterium]
MNTRLLLCGLLVALLGVSGRAQAPQTVPYDHIHLAAPDPEKAYDWYITNLNGQAGENPGRMIFERFTGGRPLPVQLMFIKAPDAAPSEGGVIDSIGFSVADVEAKVRALEAAGAKVMAPAREVTGLWKRAVVADPWGVKIELVEDRDHLGFHHLTLRVADAEATTRWFLSAFGGERVRLRGRLDALQYGTTYLLVLQGEKAAPSQGRAIDHLGWGPLSMDATAAALKAKGVTFTAEPQPKPNQLGHRTSYVEAPGGVRIELVEHAACAWGKS